MLTTNYVKAQNCESYIDNNWENNRYIIKTHSNKEQTVTDTATKLIWKRCSEGLSGNNCDIGTISETRWQTALERADNSTFAGYNDWRLPNILELMSIVAFNCSYDAVNQTIFPNTNSKTYFSSTPSLMSVFMNAPASEYIYAISLDKGNLFDLFKSTLKTAASRLVRDAE